MSGKLFRWKDLERVAAKTYEDIPQRPQDAASILQVLKYYAETIDSVAIQHQWVEDEQWRKAYAATLSFMNQQIRNAISSLIDRYGAGFWIQGVLKYFQGEDRLEEIINAYEAR